MAKRRVIPDPILMLVTILVVAGFQVYWLKNNYDRERKTLQIKSNSAFKETVRRLQYVRLKLKNAGWNDSLPLGKMKVMVKDDFHERRTRVQSLPGQEIVTMVNAVRDKVSDSLKYENITSDYAIGTRRHGEADPDSMSLRIEKHVGGGNRIFEFLYEVDSLQDSLRLSEIASAYQAKAKQENIAVPFTISRRDTLTEDEGPDFSGFTIGFVHPITYRIDLGNSFPYLIRKITLPILFSIFLVGVTILSFVVLYRNLLKQERLADLKNEFIGNITHELKTPIATVSVAIEALKSFNAMEDPERTKEYLDISSNELQRLGLLVDKVLKLSMFEKKEVELKIEPVDLRSIVDEVLASMRLQIEKFQAKVTVTQDGDGAIEGDRLHLLSVIFNLIDNALKYSSQEPTIAISLKGSPDTVELSLADNGIGIAPEYKTRIFEKFFRVPTGNTHNAKGYGLGLAYVAQVVEKHKGKIAVESELGQGTNISIIFPRNHT